jgi:lipoate-protein ligase B
MAARAVCAVERVGSLGYIAARELQEHLADEISSGTRPSTLLLLEHPHTFTVGRRGRPQDVRWATAELRARGVEVYSVDRGGEATYHGPGQLVGYPLLHLQTPGRDGRVPMADYVGYLRRLERVIIQAVASLGLVTGQVPGRTGVWVQPDVASRCRHCPPAARRAPAKLASIGVKVDVHGITRHGFALNVAPDMSFWQGIVACGLPDSPAVSLAELLEPAPTLPATADAVVAAFGRVFEFAMVEAA